ncbi:hypothetical protein D8674_004623 [Pyrus ussuriensis x Pyrus communis]|uniref:Uncharacterized protein n=1 Tax=Pyrus ussuriensis x Pyrus communis TaxID=2448454 RepID=A0A5N5FKE7_9ROSA|nr:hypothetical protein D8674_004623 [Pyrus ussuriensis x Pyrus communis]
MPPVFVFPPSLRALEEEQEDNRILAQNPIDITDLRPSELEEFVKEQSHSDMESKTQSKSDSLTPKALALIVNKTNSASTWSSLQERYASTSQNHIIQMCIELMNTSRGDISIADYLDKVNVLADNLALSGALVSKSNLVAIIMSKVGPRYETTIASAQPCDTPIAYNALKALLLSAEQRHNAFSLPSDVGTSAFCWKYTHKATHLM